MLQEVAEPQVGRRARNRQVRHAAYVTTAKRLVAAEGLEALTMQRLADAADAAIGTVYTYFPSKSALVAEVQRDAIDRLTRSYVLGRESLDDGLTGNAPEVALARLVAFGRFWVDTYTVFPDEAMLLQLLMSELKPTVGTDDASRVMPAAMRLLDQARQCIADATTAGALRDGDDMERTVVLAAAVNGVLLLSKLRRFDDDLFDGHRLAATLVADLLAGWGADTDVLATAIAAVDHARERSPLAPLVPEMES